MAGDEMQPVTVAKCYVLATGSGNQFGPVELNGDNWKEGFVASV